MSRVCCILLYVRMTMDGIFRWLKKVNNLELWDPEKRHEAAMNKLPRGIRLWTGCDDQICWWPLWHSAEIFSIEPKKLFLIVTMGPRQVLQIANNCIRHDSKIKNFLSFQSFSLTLLVTLPIQIQMTQWVSNCHLGHRKRSCQFAIRIHLLQTHHFPWQEVDAPVFRLCSSSD